MKKYKFLKNYTLLSVFLIIISSFLLLFSNISREKDIKKAIETEQTSHKKYKYAIFDVTKSFCQKSLYDLIRCYQKREKVSWTYYFKLLKLAPSYLAGNLNVNEAFKVFLDFCKGSFLQDVKKNCSYIWNNECKNYILEDPKKLFDKHKKDGAITIIAEPGMKELYVDLSRAHSFDHICSSELEIKDGKVTGKLIGDPCSGLGKYNKVKDLIEVKLGGSLKDAIFYANSHNDIPLLDQVGKAVAINPDPKLERYAKKKGWEILKFKEIIKN